MTVRIAIRAYVAIDIGPSVPCIYLSLAAKLTGNNIGKLENIPLSTFIGWPTSASIRCTGQPRLMGIPRTKFEETATRSQHADSTNVSDARKADDIQSSVQTRVHLTFGINETAAGLAKAFPKLSCPRQSAILRFSFENLAPHCRKALFNFIKKSLALPHEQQIK
jgi:hypothetical protein